MSEYGKLGSDVGAVGRWIRLIFGVWVLWLVLSDFLRSDHTHSTRDNVLVAVLFLAFVLVYQAVYLLLAEKLRDKSPWIATIIFVLPAMYFSIVNAFLVPAELSFGSLIGMPFVNHPITLAIFLYIGISFPVQFFTKYGGCEVVAIQNWLFKKSCSSYCVPLLPLDFAEKKIVDAIARKK